MKEKCVPYVILLLYKLDTGHTEMHMSDNNRGVHMVPTRPPNQIPGRTYILFSALNHLSPGTNLTINNIENIGIKRLSKKNNKPVSNQMYMISKKMYIYYHALQSIFWKSCFQSTHELQNEFHIFIYCFEIENALKVSIIRSKCCNIIRVAWPWGI